MSNATGNLLGSNRVATIDISRYISTERTYIVRGVDSSTRNDTWFLGGHASIPTRYFPFLSFETRSLRSLKRLLSFVKQFVSSVHREDTDRDDCRGEKGSTAQLREIVSVSLLLRLRYREESTSLLVNELSKDFDDITDALSVI